MKYGLGILVCAVLLISCSDAPEPVTLKPAPLGPPKWTEQAIWYEVMVERFYNADPSNDPTIENITGNDSGFIPTTWTITPWTQHWLSPDPYFEDMHGAADANGELIHHFDTKTLLRRYGGDLQGMIDKLDYLETLGINAIHMNLINDAPSSDKQNPRTWHHVDVNFGPDPNGDAQIIAAEDPVDPSTWQMTSADTLFLAFIAQAKARNIRVIVDYEWAHPGENFWAWRDVLAKQQNSPYFDWFAKKATTNDTSVNDAEEPNIELVPSLSLSTRVSANVVMGDIKNNAAKTHIMAVTRRWLDPNKDGDPSDGVDGFSLRSANKLPLGFWRDYRIYVKSINPDAYLVADLANETNDGEMFTPKQALQGEVFDGLTSTSIHNIAKDYFAQPARAQRPSELASAFKQPENRLFDNFAASSISVATRYAQASDSEKLLLIHAFTFVGAPQIIAGDEMGLRGSQDLRLRKPLIWPEYSFEAAPLQVQTLPDDHTQFDQAWFDYYQFLIKLRRANPVLASGEIDLIERNDRKRLFSYRRFNDGEQSAYIVFNTGSSRQQIILPNEIVNTHTWLLWHSNDSTNIMQSVPSEQLSIGPESAIIIIATQSVL